MRYSHIAHQIGAFFPAIGLVLDVLRQRELTLEDKSEKFQSVLVEQSRGPQLQR